VFCWCCFVVSCECWFEWFRSFPAGLAGFFSPVGVWLYPGFAGVIVDPLRLVTKGFHSSKKKKNAIFL
jgi:hypothetical protein